MKSLKALIVTTLVSVLPANAEQRQVEMPFAATHAILLDDTDQLLVWAPAAESEIGIVDLDSGKLVVSHRVSMSIIAADARDDSVYILAALSASAKLLKLNRTSFATEVQREIDVQSNTRFLEDCRLVTDQETLTIRTPSDVILRFNLSDLEEIPQSDTRTTISKKETDSVSAVRIALSGFTLPPREKPPTPLKPKSSSVGNRSFRGTEHFEVQRPGSSIKMVGSDDYPVMFSVRLVPEAVPGYSRLELEAWSIFGLTCMRRWEVALIDPTTRKSVLNVHWSVRDATAIVVFDGVAHLVDISALRLRFPAKPFRIADTEKTMFVSNDGNAQLVCDIDGGAPPYRVAFQLADGDDTAWNKQWMGEFTDAHVEIKANLSDYLQSRAVNIAQELCELANKPASADNIKKQFSSAVGAAMEMLTGKAPQGIPVGIRAIIVAIDSNNQLQGTERVLIADVPWDWIEYPLNEEVARRWKDTPVATEALARLAVLDSRQPSRRLKKLCVSIHPKSARPLEFNSKLTDIAKSALNDFEEQFTAYAEAELKRLDLLPMREWIDSKGNRIMARMDSHFAGMVTLTTAQGNKLVLSIDQFSQDDQQYIKQARPALTDSEIALIKEQRLHVVKLQMLKRAINSFSLRYNWLPPAAFVNEQESPTVSWRVLVLPFIGAGRLYSLFRLDEPWDSEHNRQLLPFMPSIYRFPTIETKPNHTAVVRPVAIGAAAWPNEVIDSQDITDGLSKTVFALIANSENSVAWTEPKDIQADRDVSFGDILHWESDRTLAVMCDGSVKTILKTTESNSWFNAVLINDGGSFAPFPD
ncbi:MAG: DUF1559 domain-containing protein [Pirellulaceae bacterium]